MDQAEHDDLARLKAELDELRLEKERLANQVKRLVQAEGRLYAHQEELDARLKEYRDLCELNRRLTATLDLHAVFDLASSYIIDTLGYQRGVFFADCGDGDDFSVCALGGYYQDDEREKLSRLRVPMDDPLLAPLSGKTPYRICPGAGCDAGLSAFGDTLGMREFLLYPIRSQARISGFLAAGNCAANAAFYRRVSDHAGGSSSIANLAGILSSALENQQLYANLEKALEQERAAEAKYRGIFENSVEGLYQTTPEGKVLSCNPAVAEILGYDSPEEVIAEINDTQRQLYVDPLRRNELIEMLRGNLEVKDFEVQFYKKDGSIRWIRLSARPHFDDSGELDYLDGIIQDITEQKATEEALLKLSQAVEQSPVTILITDTRGVIEFVNPKFVQLTGYSAEEVTGRTLSFMKSEQNPPEMYRKLWETITAGEVWEGEFINRKKNGELFFERATISPLRNRDGVIAHYLAIKEDITEKKQLEAQLLQSQKMESIGRLAGGVAHDFNNMLSVIIGCAQLAMLKVQEGDQVWQFLNQISRAAERSGGITRQLLAFSRKEIISPKKVNLNNKVLETQSTLGRLIGEDIELTFSPEAGLWSIEADPSQLDQILVNLAVNARDAMPGGGKLSIQTANLHIDATYCRFHVDSKPGDYVQLVVADTGVGMDQETVSHIFEPFFTTKEVGKGTGLGLATVYGIIRQNNGFINVYSEPGYGTSFQLHFPRYLGEDEADEEAAELELTGSGTVLLVEDDALVREMALQMLSEIGYSVIQARSPRQALEICRKNDPPIDLVLTDVVMPEMNGKEMADQILTLRPEIKVLFMSGYTSDLVAQRGVVDQGRHFIQKPFDLHSLRRKIHEALTD